MARKLLRGTVDLHGNPLSVLWEEDRILALGPEIPETEADEVLEVEGTVFPGFIDPHVHLRTPGQEHKETLETGARAAAHGGFTTVVTMPNTDPPLDRPELLRGLYEEARQLPVDVRFAACLSVGRKGRAIPEMPLLVEAGAVAFTDDGSWLEDAHVAIRPMPWPQRSTVPFSPTRKILAGTVAGWPIRGSGR